MLISWDEGGLTSDQGWEYVDKVNTTVRMGDRSRIQYFISSQGNCNQDVGSFLNNMPDLLMVFKTRRKFLAIRKKESLMGRSLHCVDLGLVPECRAGL